MIKANEPFELVQPECWSKKTQNVGPKEHIHSLVALVIVEQYAYLFMQKHSTPDFLETELEVQENRTVHCRQQETTEFLQNSTR